MQLNVKHDCKKKNNNRPPCHHRKGAEQLAEHMMSSCLSSARVVPRSARLRTVACYGRGWKCTIGIVPKDSSYCDIGSWQRSRRTHRHWYRCIHSIRPHRCRYRRLAIVILVNRRTTEQNNNRTTRDRAGPTKPCPRPTPHSFSDFDGWKSERTWRGNRSTSIEWRAHGGVRKNW